jgi:hypothetical protein
MSNDHPTSLIKINKLKLTHINVESFLIKYTPYKNDRKMFVSSFVNTVNECIMIILLTNLQCMKKLTYIYT